MKTPLSLAIVAGLSLVALSQTGCVGVYPAPPYPRAYVPPPVVPSVAWRGAGFYGGTYYATRRAYYGSSYYRGARGYAYRTPWSYGGSYSGPRVSASWHNGSGSASGWRGGSASWGGGSGSWHGPRGRSGSWQR